MKKIAPVAIAVIKRESNYLLTRRKVVEPEDRRFNDHWQFPGGGIEFAESPEEAVTREIREEAGVEIEIISALIAWNFGYSAASSSSSVGQINVKSAG